MVTLILRLHDDPAGGLKGTVEEPGKAPELFRNGDELESVLRTLVNRDGDPHGWNQPPTSASASLRRRELPPAPMGDTS